MKKKIKTRKLRPRSPSITQGIKNTVKRDKEIKVYSKQKSIGAEIVEGFKELHEALVSGEPIKTTTIFQLTKPVTNKGPDTIPESTFYMPEHGVGEIRMNVPRIQTNDFLIAPPYGHLGVICLPVQPNCVVGDKIILIQDTVEEIARGYITAIEKPRSCIRKDVKNKGLDKWKIHWVPVSFDSYMSMFLRALKAMQFKSKKGKRAKKNPVRR